MMVPPAPTEEEDASIIDRMIDVVWQPRALFRALDHARPSFKNWLLPQIVAFVIAMVATTFAFLRPDVAEDIKRMQRLKLYESSARGDIASDQLGDALTVVNDRGNRLALAAQWIVLPVILIVALIWWAFVIWLIGDSIAPQGIDYLRALEIAGLATTIEIPKYLFFGAASTWFGRIALLNAAILNTSFDPTKRADLLIGSLDPFNVWKIVVISIGIATLGRMGLAKTIAVIGAVWLLTNIALVLVGWGDVVQ